MERAVGFVQSAGLLDLFHFRLRGQIEAELLFDEFLLLGGGVEQVDPKRVGKRLFSRRKSSRGTAWSEALPLSRI